MDESNAPADHPTSSVSVVVLGASAGGLDALTAVLPFLPSGLGVPVVVVQHLQRDHASRLGDILARHVSLPVETVSDGGVLEPGAVHVIPAGHDLSVAAGGSLTVAPCTDVPFACPSIDRVFSSAAAVFGAAVVAVVLTGTGRDGEKGVMAVKEAGGTVIVEDDRTAAFRGMPRAAIETGVVDMVLPAAEIGPALLELVRTGSAA